MERQAPRDAVIRSNAEGLAGLHDRPKPGRSPRVLRDPDPEMDGAAAWTRADLCRWPEDRCGTAR